MNANKQLEKLAKTDSLTGFYNRLALRNDLVRHLENAAYQDFSVSFIMADIDLFKNINDKYGHDVGDEVLRQFSDRLRSLLRQGDIVYRMGGEEFLLIAPDTEEKTGMMVAERVRKTIADAPFTLSDGRRLDVRCSLGVCTMVIQDTLENFETPIKHADLALYASKSNGRNRVTLYDKNMK